MPRSRAGATFAVIEAAAGQPLNVAFWGLGADESISKLNPSHNNQYTL
jgi:hypothetical protein